MISLEGKYFDGINSVAVPARLVARDDGAAELHHDGKSDALAVANLKIEARLGNTPRQITWDSRSRFVTPDHAGADALAALLPQQDRLRLVSWLEARMGIALAAAALILALGAGLAVWGVPALSKAAAFTAPAEVSAQLGASTLGTIDRLLAPSTLESKRQAELADYFAEFGAVDTMEFRRGGHIGANAFTLSATTVVMTDELVNLATTDEQLLAVYLHELGHARLRHVERSILQNSMWVVLFTIVAGDFSGAGELILSLPIALGEMAYSREFEREADRYAIEAMLDAGLDPGEFANILERISGRKSRQNAADSHAEPTDNDAASNPDQPDDHIDAGNQQTDAGNQRADTDNQWAESVLDYFSTHPATAERVNYIRASARR